MKEQHGARHFCSAWVLGDEGERYRANDAGEPAGTAGKPILSRIRALHLSYCGVIVVRYFGGTLLGKAGLVHAYGDAAQLALSEAPMVEHIVRDRLRIVCSYAQLEAVRNTVIALEGELLDSTFGEVVVLDAALPRSITAGTIAGWATQGIKAVRS
jgi:uncharacterized YigZ family protein